MLKIKNNMNEIKFNIRNVGDDMEELFLNVKGQEESESIILKSFSKKKNIFL